MKVIKALIIHAKSSGVLIPVHVTKGHSVSVAAVRSTYGGHLALSVKLSLSKSPPLVRTHINPDGAFAPHVKRQWKDSWSPGRGVRKLGKSGVKVYCSGYWYIGTVP